VWGHRCARSAPQSDAARTSQHETAHCKAFAAAHARWGQPRWGGKGGAEVCTVGKGAVGRNVRRRSGAAGKHSLERECMMVRIRNQNAASK
jgi:hypothetical protein